jgi:hypothetical protein
MGEWRPMLKNHHVFALVLAASIGLASARADGASQVLGLVASNGLPTPLQCQDGTCSAHLSSFCLQQARPAPSANSEYELASGGTVTLLATLADGRQIRMPGERLVSLHTMIGFTSVRISLPEASLRKLGAISVAVDIGPLTAVVPTPIAADPNPQTSEEIAYAIGPMRRLAEGSFEERGAGADAARLGSLLINTLPPEEPQTAEGRDAVLAQVLARPGTGSLSPEGIAEARQMYSSCEISVASKSAFNLKSCMELRHADLMAVTNRSFWDRTGGS